VKVAAERAADLGALYSPATVAAERAASAEALRAVIGPLADALVADTQRLRVASRGGLVGDTYVAPLGEAARGRLHFTSGAPRLTMSAFALGQHARMVVETAASRLRLGRGVEPGELVRARFRGAPPDIRAIDGTVTVRYRRRAVDFQSRAAEISLNPSIPWSIVIDGGVTDLRADLTDLQVDGVELRGGANHLRLELPQPRGSVRVRVEGGASDIVLRRPAGTAASLEVRGGASHLRMDDHRHETVTSDLMLRSDGFASATDRYEIGVSGGASHITVAARS
jgi:hypothetical protein